jgi:hypothetical protein
MSKSGKHEQVDILRDFPHMQSWNRRMRKLPRLAEYLERRPEIIDVGTDPGLMDRNGRVVRQRGGEGRLWLKDGLFCDEP